MKNGLEYVSILVTLLNVIFGAIINYRIIKIVVSEENDEDYRVSLLQKHLADIAAEHENLQQVYNEAKEDALEKRKHKLKRLVQSPNSFFMDVKCPGCFNM